MYPTKQESILETIQNSKPLQNIVVTNGITAYKNVINTHKCHLFEEKNNILIGSPSLEWANRSITDLTLLVDKLSEGLTKESYTYKGINSIIKTAKETKDRLTNNLESYRGFIEDGNWSILNKVDTNYSNWIKLMIPVLDEGKLGSGTTEQKINRFFEQSPIISIVSQEDIETLKNVEQKYDCTIETLSYAEYQLYKDYLNNYKISKTNIGRTTYIGDLEENNFKEHIFSKIKKTDLIDFSSPGNQVDQIFGIDFLVNLVINGRDRKWIPIQIKARKKNSEFSLILKSVIGGLVVFPAQNFEVKMKGRYGFFDIRGGEERSFDDIFMK